MLGTIISVEENVLSLKLNVDLKKMHNLINYYVVIEDPERKIIGEIIDIKEDIALVNLQGELKPEGFVFGITKKPSFGSSVKLVSREKISYIIGIPDYQENKHLILGDSPLYDIPLGVDINTFFSNHFAIFGSTGSGKSSAIARIFQNLFSKEKTIPYLANIIIFDAYGEYHSAFKYLNEKTNGIINFKAYTTNLHFGEGDILRIPLWLLGVDDIALLLSADEHSQLPIIEKSLKLVTIFAREEELVIKNKNDIIARALLDILSSGGPASQIRDQIVSVLSYYNTSELNLETPVFQPGYTRPLKQCLLIDASGKMRDIELVINFLETFLVDDMELSLPDGSFKYDLNDLKDAFDFALISEGVLTSRKVFDSVNILKVRLHELVNSESRVYFDYPEYVTKDQYIRNLFTADNHHKAQIINFNINYIDDRLAKTITKIYSKLFFDYSKGLENRGSMPFHIILEEAHRYVQNDNDVNLIGYNIFDRITKEGRKYGVVLGMITQRPSEISETAFSQCSNFLVFKMIHPRDISYIKETVPNITNEIIKKMRILQPGTCVAFGIAFKVPVIIKFKMPNPEPSSSNCDVGSIWFRSKGKEVYNEKADNR